MAGYINILGYSFKILGKRKNYITDCIGASAEVADVKASLFDSGNGRTFLNGILWDKDTIITLDWRDYFIEFGKTSKICKEYGLPSLKELRAYLQKMRIRQDEEVVENTNKTTVSFRMHTPNYKKGLFGFEKTNSETVYHTALGDIKFDVNEKAERTEFLKYLIGKNGNPNYKIEQVFTKEQQKKLKELSLKCCDGKEYYQKLLNYLNDDLGLDKANNDKILKLLKIKSPKIVKFDDDFNFLHFKMRSKGLYGIEKYKDHTVCNTVFGDVTFRADEQAERRAFLKFLIGNGEPKINPVDSLKKIFTPEQHKKVQELVDDFLNNKSSYQELIHYLNQDLGMNAARCTKVVDMIYGHRSNFIPKIDLGLLPSKDEIMKINPDGHVYRFISKDEFDKLMNGEKVKCLRCLLDVSINPQLNFQGFARISFKRKLGDEGIMERFSDSCNYLMSFHNQSYSLDDVTSIDRILPNGYLNIFKNFNQQSCKKINICRQENCP